MIFFGGENGGIFFKKSDRGEKGGIFKKRKNKGKHIIYFLLSYFAVPESPEFHESLLSLFVMKCFLLFLPC